MSYVMHPNVKDYLCYVLDSNEARRVLGGGTMFHFDPRPKPYIDQWQAFSEPKSL